MPTDSADASLGFFGSTNTAASRGDFLQSMQDAMESVQDGSEVSVSAALEADAEAGRPVVESPYTRTTTDGVTYTLSEVCFTKQELAELRQQLVKEGAPEEALKQFDILASQPNGATLAQVMASLQVAGTTPNLNEEDEHTIIALLGQIDPTGDLAQDVLAKMRDGNGEAALELIAQGFANMDAGSSIEISVDEALALGRGLGLDAGSLMNLAGNFGGFPALKVTAEQFGNLMAPATAKLTQQRANQEKLDAAVEKTLKPIISKARDRMEKEKAASELENRRVQQSRILIDRTVQEKSRGILDETLAADAETVADKQQLDMADVMSRKADAEKSAMVGHAGKEESASRRPGAEAVENASRRQNVAETAQERQASAASNAEGARNTAAARDMGNDARHGADDSATRDSRDNKNPEWNELLGKVETRTAAPSQPTTAASGSFLYTMLQGGQNIPDAVQAQDASQLPQITRQVAQQVEQGMLTAMRDGATRLDLQLHPAELGAITITLVARNGEVSAQIRSEKSETAEMVSRQLDTIRVNLEQQGIKVDKIEVQME
ncbi:MAG: flagellar hook-length control protein FliK, partial [Desulfovibrio sp.]|nr:flagellar hook-length control protein FliK [Desulfovibrio sp.]